MKTKDTVRVDLAGRSYDITIGAGLLTEVGSYLKGILSRPRVVIVTDANVARLHLGKLKDGLARTGITGDDIVLPPGEGTKSFGHLAALCDRLLERGVERNDTIAAFGGGVIGDLVGFTA